MNGSERAMLLLAIEAVDILLANAAVSDPTTMKKIMDMRDRLLKARAVWDAAPGPTPPHP